MFALRMYSIVSSPPNHVYRFFLSAGGDWGVVGGWISDPYCVVAASGVLRGGVLSIFRPKSASKVNKENQSEQK